MIINGANIFKPTLYIFSGLPGSGKSVLSQRLALHEKAFYLRVDTLEQGLRELCSISVKGEGYGLLYRIAADNLRLGLSVVADSCNPIGLTRNEWENVAKKSGAGFVNIEVICSDKGEHRRRVETRSGEVPGLKLPPWKEVMERQYEPWSREHIAIDTSGKSVEESFASLLSFLQVHKDP